MKHLITLAVVTAGIAYLVKRKKQESINPRSAMDTIYQPNLSVPSRIPLHTSSILKQEAESERIRNKILSGRYGI